MQDNFKIVVATDISRLPSELRFNILDKLDNWSFSLGAEVIRVPPATSKFTKQLFDDCDAVITRPTDSIRLSPKLFRSATQKVYLYSASVGTNHLEDFKALKKFEIVNTAPFDNSRGVSNFNILLASSLLGSIPESLSNIGRGEFINTSYQSTLSEKTWMTFGSGGQVSRIVEAALSSGVKKFFFYNPRLNSKKFRDCFEHVGKIVSSSLTVNCDEAKKKFLAEISFKEPYGWTRSGGIEFEGVTDAAGLRKACAAADVVSINMPLIQENDKDGRVSNVGYVNSKLIAKFKKGPILINTARGELLNEEDVLSALQSRALSGVGVDVLNKGVEDTYNCELSALWNFHDSKHELSSRVIITPHIAGAVDTDLKPMWGQLLTHLEDRIKEKFYSPNSSSVI